MFNLEDLKRNIANVLSSTDGDTEPQIFRFGSYLNRAIFLKLFGRFVYKGDGDVILVGVVMWFAWSSGFEKSSNGLSFTCVIGEDFEC